MQYCYICHNVVNKAVAFNTTVHSCPYIVCFINDPELRVIYGMFSPCAVKCVTYNNVHVFRYN